MNSPMGVKCQKHDYDKCQKQDYLKCQKAWLLVKC